MNFIINFYFWENGKICNFDKYMLVNVIYFGDVIIFCFIDVRDKDDVFRLIRGYVI